MDGLLQFIVIIIISVIIKNKSKIISFDQAIKKVNNSLFFKSINWMSEKTLKIIRSF